MDPRGFIPTDMHGNVTIRLGETKTMSGRPVAVVRRKAP